MFDKFIKALFGSQNERDLKAIMPILQNVNAKESWARALNAEDFPRQTALFRERYKNGESLDGILPLKPSCIIHLNTFIMRHAMLIFSSTPL